MHQFQRILLLTCTFVGFLTVQFSVNGQTLHNKKQHENEWFAFRPEGHSLGKALLKTNCYLHKYKNKRICTSDEELNYFKLQRTLQQQVKLQEKVPYNTYRLGFVGDVMWIRSHWNTFLDHKVKSLLEAHQLVFGNLETMIDTTQLVKKFWGDYQSYNSPPALINSFDSETEQRPLLNVLSLANNHSLDRGVSGLQNTATFLKNKGIRTNGILDQQQHAYTRIQLGTISIGYVAATWGFNQHKFMTKRDVPIRFVKGLAPLQPDSIQLDQLERALTEMEADHIDMKIISLHWGYEFETYPDAEVMKVARRLVLAGADVILGSHPHVFQPNEVLFVNGYEKHLHLPDSLTQGSVLQTKDGIQRKALVCYSLGNFLTTMYTASCRLGVLQSVQVYQNPKTKHVDFTLPDFHFVYNQTQGKDGRKLLMLKEEVKQLMAEPTKYNRESLKQIERMQGILLKE